MLLHVMHAESFSLQRSSSPRNEKANVCGGTVTTIAHIGAWYTYLYLYGTCQPCRPLAQHRLVGERARAFLLRCAPAQTGIRRRA